MSELWIEEGEIDQTSDETIRYTLNNLVGPPTAVVSVTVHDLSTAADDDVSATVLENESDTLNNDNSLILRGIGSLTAEHRYRVRTVYSTAGQPAVEVMFFISCPI